MTSSARGEATWQRPPGRRRHPEPGPWTAWPPRRGFPADRGKARSSGRPGYPPRDGPRLPALPPGEAILPHRLDLLGEPLQQARLAVMAQGDGFGGQAPGKQRQEGLRQEPGRTRVVGLEHQVAGVGVRHQAREAVGFGVDEAAGVALPDHPLPVGQGPEELASEKAAVTGSGPEVTRRRAIRDLALETPGRGSGPPASHHRGQLPGGQTDLAVQVVAVQPGVAVMLPAQALGVDPHYFGSLAPPDSQYSIFLIYSPVGSGLIFSPPYFFAEKRSPETGHPPG